MSCRFSDLRALHGRAQPGLRHPAPSLADRLAHLLLGISVVPTLSMLPMDLVRCLNQLRCPRILSLGLLIALRFMPIMGQEIQRIRRAMKLRGVNAAWYNPGFGIGRSCCRWLSACWVFRILCPFNGNQGLRHG